MGLFPQAGNRTSGIQYQDNRRPGGIDRLEEIQLLPRQVQRNPVEIFPAGFGGVPQCNDSDLGLLGQLQRTVDGFQPGITSEDNPGRPRVVSEFESTLSSGGR